MGVWRFVCVVYVVCFCASPPPPFVCLCVYVWTSAWLYLYVCVCVCVDKCVRARTCASVITRVNLFSTRWVDSVLKVFGNNIRWWIVQVSQFLGKIHCVHYRALYLLSVIKSRGVGEEAHFHNEAVGLSHSDEEWIYTKWRDEEKKNSWAPFRH